MDAQQAQFKQISGLLSTFVALVAAMAIGFGEFPERARFVGATLIFVHLCAVWVVSAVQAERHQADRGLWFQVLVLRFGLIDIGRAIVAGNQLANEDDELQLWRNASARARDDILVNDEGIRLTEKLGLPVFLRLVLSLAGVVAYYAVAVGIAVFVRRFVDM